MRRTAGFTLVEVIISLILVSLLLLALVSSLRTFGDTSVRVEQRALVLDELRIVPGFLADIIGSASSRARREPTANGAHWLRGNAEELEWLGVMPARHGVGGLSHFRLSRQDWYGRPSLVLQITPFRGDDQPSPDWSQLEPEAVAENVVTATFAYLSGDGGEWLPQWDDDKLLPGWVRLSVTTARDAWPLLVFRLNDVRVTAADEHK